MIRTIIALGGLMMIAGCAAPVADGDDGGIFETYRNTDVPMVSVRSFDAGRYLGTWYEISRVPVFFERGCANVTAVYGRIDADTVSVTNVCRDIAGAETSTIVGTADIVGDGKLAVQFPTVPFGAADYWVLWIDDGYSVAVVGAPNGKSGWVLARDPMPDAMLVTAARKALVRNGYDLNRLLNVPQGAAP